MDRIREYLQRLYGDLQTQQLWPRLMDLMDSYRREGKDPGKTPVDTLQNLGALLITYGDQFQVPDQSHFTTLAEFISEYLEGLISAVHLLPFFPYSSDDGFSVINYKEVHPDFGSWDDLLQLGRCCYLMFDAVVNHVSRESEWFQKYLQKVPPYRDYFIEVDPGVDLSQVVRPRARPLLTEVQTAEGPAWVWTTFSTDQIDLNYKNPQVLLEIIDVLLFYVSRGARIIRLDAIAFLWKEIGTPCIHLPQTHLVIKLMRAVLDVVEPEVILITETNVPQEENSSYFGEPLGNSSDRNTAGDEAQMVYQFPLAPLILHTFRTGNTEVLTDWASTIAVPYDSAAFLNFIASHDGIGLRPAEGLLTEAEIQALVDQTLARGGRVSYRSGPDGNKSVYELNITLFDMLTDPGEADLEKSVARFMASQAIMLSLAGVPAIYALSLFGAPNNQGEVENTGRARSINRQKYVLSDLEQALADPSSRAARVFSAYRQLLKARKDHPAFHPLASQQVLKLDSRIVAVLRTAGEGRESVLCLINVAAEPVELQVEDSLLGPRGRVDLLTGTPYRSGRLALDPFQTLWLSGK